MVSEEEQTQRIAQFVGITQSSPEEAQDCLLHTDWDVAQAVDLFLSANDEPEVNDDDAENDDAEDVGIEDDSDAYTNPSGLAPTGIAAGIQGFLSGLAGREDPSAPAEPQGILSTPQPSGFRLGDGTGSSTPIGGSSDATPSSSTPAPAPAPAPRRGVAGVRTLGDLSRDNSNPQKRQDLFTGGEKSALAVHNPNRPGQPSQGNPLVNDIIRRAEANPSRPRGEGEEESDEEEERHTFHGTGFTLGSDEVQSRPVENDLPSTLPKVSRSITFWQNGFTVEDGPLYRYDDPRNQRYLETLNQGRAPLALLDVQHNQAVDINVTDRSEEAYVEKKPVYGGSGNRLGSPVPGEHSPSPSPAPASVPSASSTPAAAPAASGSASGAGGSRIQIRLGDGTRLTPSFSPDLTVQALYDFVDSHNSSGRAYVLQTTFPNKELRDKSVSLKDAQVIGAALVQRYE